ncbi:porin [Cyclobacterium sp.]|uniref:OprO/OprP family phosphate-selective porin n=1 Tax=Cyclobacterium sp. TaxID=1966343 RepID=UPI0019C4E049|nr:porin [Cyclobacterium sp.]MBD3627225.1 porin [Cyclobacterium sp.]
MKYKNWLYFFVWLPHFALAFHGENDSIPEQTVRYGSRGFQFSSADGKYQLNFGGRLQFRFATPSDQDPITYDDFFEQKQNLFKINRARLKVGGHAYQPWLKYYFEYELGASRLLDFRVMVEKWPWLSFKVGQWKSEYTRERVISSGNQQMMERSIINRPFTLDRQQGVTLYGRWDGGGLADFNYHLMVLTGTGIGARNNDDQNLMYSGRLQWNILGDGVAMSGSALTHHQKPVASLAWAGATNTSQYTRYSSQGGGQLVGFEGSNPGQYQIDQYLLESTLKYKSFSWHSEFHRKSIFDNQLQELTKLQGWFVQGGFILNPHARDKNKPLLELASRYAFYQPNSALEMNNEEEISLAFNCFFNGHQNKLTADITHFDFEQKSVNREASGWRFRIQYDFSF